MQKLSIQYLWENTFTVKYEWNLDENKVFHHNKATIAVMFMGHESDDSYIYMNLGHLSSDNELCECLCV